MGLVPEPPPITEGHRQAPPATYTESQRSGDSSRHRGTGGSLIASGPCGSHESDSRVLQWTPPMLGVERTECIFLRGYERSACRQSANSGRPLGVGLGGDTHDAARHRDPRRQATVPSGHPMRQDPHARARRARLPSASKNAISFTSNLKPKRPPPETDVDRWLNTDEACIHLGCHERTLRRVIASGRLKVYRLGRHLKYRRQDLDKLLEPVNAGTAVKESVRDFIQQQQKGTP